MIVFKLFSIITFLGNSAKNRFAERSVWEAVLSVLSVFRIDLVPECLVHWKKKNTHLTVGFDVVVTFSLLFTLLLAPEILFLDAFPNCEKRLLASSCLSVPSIYPSVRMEQRGCYWTDFHEILYLSIFRKNAEKIQVPLKYDKNNGYFT